VQYLVTNDIIKITDKNLFLIAFKAFKEKCIANYSIKNSEEIKALEQETNHDVKAAE